MFEARFLDGATFKKLVEALKDFKEINLECDYNGISLKVMDESHVSLADLRLSSSFFEHYRCDASCTIGINTEALTRVVRLAPNERALSLRKLDDTDRLRIESDEEPETGLNRAADMALITITGEALQVPEQEFQVDVEIPTKLYSLMVKDLSSVGDDVRICVTSRAIKFEADGERGRVENVFQKGQGAFTSTTWRFNEGSGSVVEQSFAVRFLAGFSKACPLSETATLSMSRGVPLRLQFPLGEDSYLSYYVAPALD